jgi:hypothetical protein
MRTRMLAMLAALAMLASLFLTWTSPSLGTTLVPWDVVSGLTREEAELQVRTASPEFLAILASFALAALFVLAAVIGLERRWLALLTGLAPLGVVAWTLYRARETMVAGGLPAGAQEMLDFASQSYQTLGTGTLAWLGGAAVLLLLGLFDPGNRPAAPTGYVIRR